MTIEQANEYFSSLPEGFAPAEELRAALLTADVQKVQFVGVAGTAGKTAAAGLLAAILREAAFHTGFYRAGCEPLSARIAIGGVSVDPMLLCQAAEALSAAKPLPREAAELAAAARCFGAAGCKLAVVELPGAGLASGLPNMPVCAVTAIGPDGVSRSVERLAALAAGVMRKDAVCVTAPEQPKAVLSELVVAAAKAECELVVPDAEDITFLEAEKFTSKVDYGGYTAPLAFLGRHAAGNAAVAVELALALWRKGFEIPDEAILAGLAAVENRSSIRVLSQKPLIILDACRTPQQAAALLRVLNMAKVRHMSAVIGLTEEEGAESFLAALETGLTSEEQKKDKSTMPGMGENPFDKVFLVAPAGTEAALAERLTEKARYHFDAVFCPTLAEAVEQAKANSRRGLLVCGSEAIALGAEKLLETAERHRSLKNNPKDLYTEKVYRSFLYARKKGDEDMATVTFSAADDVLYAYLAGEIDHDAAQGLRIQLDDALLTRSPRILVIDLGGVGFMDSSGIGLILGRQRCARTLGGSLRIQHAPEQLRRVLQLASIPCTEPGGEVSGGI